MRTRENEPGSSSDFLEDEGNQIAITLQVITPFAEIAHFKAGKHVKSVTIHDANGKHIVKVTPAKKTN